MNDQIINELKSKLQGKVVQPNDSNYDELRKIWNAMIDRKPAVIVQCKGSEDVMATVQVARENDIEFSVRGAGHNIAGNSLCDGGIVIDLSGMKNVNVDTTRQRALVEPGATLGDFDEAAQKHGLATPVGINSTTGISGLTLGGGFGWLTRKHGMTVDNLISVDLVTADGNIVKASENENADLFWAVRGGGGNFGIVTQFEFQLHPVGPEIMAGLLVYPLDQAKEILAKYLEFAVSAPEELCIWVVLRHAPPLPFLPENVHGKKVVVFAIFYSGNADEGLKLVQPIKSFGDLYGEHVGPVQYSDWQKAFDPLLTPGARNYWKTHNFTQISDDALDVMIEYANSLPTQQCEIFLAQIDGAANRVSPDAMAYANRNAKFVLNVHGRWESKEDDERCIKWARDFFAASKPYASAGAYVNFMTEEEGVRVESAYGKSYGRLVELKNKFDPNNVFHFNQNIKP